MPVSRRTAEGGEENNSEGDGKRSGSLEEGGDHKRKRKRKSKPTSKARARKQNTKDRYAHAREDAQLEGLIPTTPEEALKPEQVDPSTQDEQPILPGMVARAIRQGWNVPESRKPDLVAELIGIIDNPDMPAKVKVAAFNALRLADQTQWERDHPEMMAKMKGQTGSTTNVYGNVVQNNVAAAAMIREMVSSGELGLIEELPASPITSAPGDGRQQRQVDSSTAPESDEQRSGPSVENTQQSDRN